VAGIRVLMGVPLWSGRRRIVSRYRNISEAIRLRCWSRLRCRRSLLGRGSRNRSNGVVDPTSHRPSIRTRGMPIHTPRHPI